MLEFNLCVCFCGSDSGRGSSLLDRAIADRRQLNAMTLPDFSDPETGMSARSQNPQVLLRLRPSGRSLTSATFKSLQFFCEKHFHSSSHRCFFPCSFHLITISFIYVITALCWSVRTLQHEKVQEILFPVCKSWTQIKKR